MPISIRVSSWLREQPGESFCDECIGTRFLATRRRPDAYRLTSALAMMTEFERKSGTCRVCGEKKVVIRAV
jgi:hypothetical protein